MAEQLRAIQEYIYAKYIEGSGAPPIDELAAVAILHDYYAAPGRESDPDCFYPGILYFELGWEQEDQQVEFFTRAKAWLERWKGLADGEEWDAIDDRLLDLDDFLAERGIEVDDGAIGGAGDGTPAMAPVGVQEIEDKHGPMLLIPGGAFLFGPENEAVSLAPYYIDKYPVTNRQYENYCRATGYRFPKHWKEDRFNAPDAPVVGISVSDAQKFSRWVGKDLPSEQQWEKACRGIDGRDLPWGEEAQMSEAHACHGRDAAEGGTAPVESTTESTTPYGVRDMIGNVWEWTSTEDHDAEPIHVIKGGCYNDPAEFLSATQRLGAGPKDKFETIGFRCVRPA